jgi:hypothetical protein
VPSTFGAHFAHVAPFSGRLAMSRRIDPLLQGACEISITICDILSRVTETAAANPLFLYKIEVHFIWNLYANCYTL